MTPKDQHPDLEEARRVLQVEADAILGLLERLDEQFIQAVELLSGCRGRVITTGMGKSGIIARKLAATFSSTGTPAQFLHPAEAVHGDLGIVTTHDLVIALSHSGETEEIGRLLETIKRLDVSLIALTGKKDSTLARYADVVLDVGVSAEACPMGLAPTASTTAALVMGDALAMALLKRKGFRDEDFAALHPGGRLGARLRRVRDMMHQGAAVPLVTPETPLGEVIGIMSAGRLGMAVVTGPDGRLAGVITDGDLRRLLANDLAEGSARDLLAFRAAGVMSASPRTIAPDALASQALRLMESHKITSLVVAGKDQRPVGVVHLHDLWRMGMV
ncbi:MAG: KpsF/GutQ family sugar-phosphate isomerase [Acidobacteria bacterium]|nr:MAG: KpsF/GutQ family sugar-phosphate isomerase [Acidobacteriota bacterium]TDI42784.1 MAG: KpsF/GutQ family sugar-phosphate isomerase [Acidobacteriota bacterium]